MRRLAPFVIGWGLIVLVGLKLTGLIGWSWWWVLAPLWLPWALTLSAVGGLLLWSFVGHLRR